SPHRPLSPRSAGAWQTRCCEARMRKLLPQFEHRAQPVIPPHHFMVRLAHSGAIALVLIAVSLAVGMAGYHSLEGLGWMDAFLNASMLLGGMGPVTTPVTDAGKLF